MTELTQTHTTSSAAAEFLRPARLSTYIYLFLVLSNLTLLLFEFLFADRDITGIVNFEINLFPIAVFFLAVGMTVFIVNRILPDNSGTRSLSKPFFNAVSLLFLVFAVGSFVTTSHNLRYLSGSFVDRYNLLQVSAMLLQVPTKYLAAICLVSRSQSKTSMWARAAIVLGNILLIDGLASGLLAAAVFVVLFPTVFRPKYILFVCVAFGALFAYGQYEKIGPLESSPYFQTLVGAEKYTQWIVARFANHSLALSFYLSHADRKKTEDAFWTITADNLKRRICLMTHLSSSQGSCPGVLYKSFSQYNYENLTGLYDPNGGASPGLFATNVAIFGAALGSIVSGLLIALIGHAIQSFYRGERLGLVAVFALIYLLRGVFDENTDLLIVFAGATVEWAAFLITLTVGAHSVGDGSGRS